MSALTSLRRIAHTVEKRVRQGLVQARIRSATSSARRAVSTAHPVRILVDNSVIAHCRIHESRWLDTGKVLWGGKHGVSTGYAGPYPLYSPDEHERICSQLPFLPGIVALAASGQFKLLTSFEMKAERMHQPMGRYAGYGYFDYSLLDGFDVVDCIDCAEVLSYDWRERPQDRLRGRTDEPYRSIVALIGERNNVDAWHIHTMGAYGLDFFLHTDFRLLRKLDQYRSTGPIRDLLPRIVLPEQLAERFSIRPVALPGLMRPGSASRGA